MVNRIRLGDQCLDGVMALLQTCVLDAEGLGDEFQAGQWRCVADVVELPIIVHEAGRLADDTELRGLLERYYRYCFEDLRAEFRDAVKAADKINEIMAAVPHGVARRVEHALAARSTAPAGRLGDRCLRGLTALLTACMLDAESLGDGFKPRPWKILDRLLGIDVIRFELDRLSDEDYAAFRELVSRYRQRVFGKEPQRFRLPPRRDLELCEQCLRGVIAMFTACIRDAESLGDEFDAKEWRCFEELVGVDPVRFALDRLNDEDYQAFLDVLKRYRDCVFPGRHGRSVPKRLRLPDQRTQRTAKVAHTTEVPAPAMVEIARTQTAARGQEQWKPSPFMRSPSASR